MLAGRRWRSGHADAGCIAGPRRVRQRDPGQRLCRQLPLGGPFRRRQIGEGTYFGEHHPRGRECCRQRSEIRQLDQVFGNRAAGERVALRRVPLVTAGRRTMPGLRPSASTMQATGSPPARSAPPATRRRARTLDEAICRSRRGRARCTRLAVRATARSSAAELHPRPLIGVQQRLSHRDIQPTWPRPVRLR